MSDLTRPQVAMILAAGRGERMRPLTDVTPKPMLKVHGMPLIERHVIALAAARFTRIVINLHWLGEQISGYLGDGKRYGVEILYSEEAPHALETGGGIFHALPLLGPGPFAVVNGDILTDFSFETLALAGHRDSHLVLVPNPSYLQGDFGLVDGNVVESGATLYTYGCISLYRPSFFAGCAAAAFRLKPLMLRSMSQKRCSGELFSGNWQDVGTVERLAALNQATA